MPNEKRPLKVFLCHAHADKAQAHELYRTLKRRGLQPWLDAEDLLPGQTWQVEIPKALESSDAIIILLSKTSVDKEGYVQKEIKFALDKALEMPEGRIFLIPARLEECDVPRSISGYHWVDLFEEGGYDKLMKSLKARATQLQRTLKPGNKEPEEPIAIEMLGTISSDQGPSPVPRQNRLQKSDVIAAIPPTGVIPSSSTRLKQALALINDAKNALEKITIPRLAQLLRISVTHEVEACFEGKAEASVFFLEKFADFFGVNQQWLQFGEGRPFETTEEVQIFPFDYYDRIKSLNAQGIFFVRENSNAGRTAILIKLSEHKFTYFPHEYKVSSGVGGTGRSQLVSIYRLIEKIDKDRLPFSSRQIPTKDFNEFINGDVYPGKIAEFPISFWATDFLGADFGDEEKYDAELHKAHEIVWSEIYPKVRKVKPKPEKLASPLLTEQTTPKKPLRKLKPEFMFVIAPIIALLLGILTQVIKFAPMSTATNTVTSTVTTVFTQNPTATFTNFPPSKIPEPSLTSTETYTPTANPLPTEITDTQGVKMMLVSDDTGSFYMDKYEVTNFLYKECVDAKFCTSPTNPYYYNKSGYSDHPVVYVDFNMAKSFCEWRDARLPTIDEWRYATYGDTTTTFSWVTRHDCKYANFAYGELRGTAKSLYCVGSTVPVGSYEMGKSVFDIFDLIGNAKEWVSDNGLGTRIFAQG